MVSNTEHYFSEVVREKVMSPQGILDGESIIQEFDRGVGPGLWILLIICLFFIPLLPVAIAIILYEKFFHLKHSRLYLTNKRLVYSNKMLKYYHFHSIPLSHIKTIRRASMDSPFQGMIDRIFGFSDIQIWTDESILRQLVISDVKKSKDLVKIVEKNEGRKIGKI